MIKTHFAFSDLKFFLNGQCDEIVLCPGNESGNQKRVDSCKYFHIYIANSILAGVMVATSVTLPWYRVARLGRMVNHVSTFLAVGLRTTLIIFENSWPFHITHHNVSGYLNLCLLGFLAGLNMYKEFLHSR